MLMAETLGSLVDKLSIKDIKLWHLEHEMNETATSDLKRAEIKEKLDIVREQRQDLKMEIDDFLAKALRGEVKLRDQKVKLYNKPIPERGTTEREQLGELTDRLSLSNIGLWHLEDEVRRTDVSDSYLVKTKRDIDRANQERNDLIDRIDEVLERAVEGET